MSAAADRILFDPTLCPLLDGLSEEEQAERMQRDPAIRACLRKLEGGTAQLDGCHVGRAYAARARKRCTPQNAAPVIPDEA